MNQLTNILAAAPRNLLNLFFTAGYPKLEDTTKILSALQTTGVDMVEIGMPYSDPLADGETIQNSSSIALENGMNLQVLFEQLKSVANNRIPIILMGYYNQLLQFGIDQFLAECQAANVAGLIIPDLPLAEYELVLAEKLQEKKIAISFLVTPNTSEERIEAIKAASSSFVYVVADNSITGSASEISTEQLQYFERIKNSMQEQTHLIGFGIKDKKSFETAAAYANGAIIGSAFIKALAKMEDFATEIPNYVMKIKS